MNDITVLDETKKHLNNFHHKHIGNCYHGRLAVQIQLIYIVMSVIWIVIILLTLLTNGRGRIAIIIPIVGVVINIVSLSLLQL